MIIEYCRNILNIKDACSEEFDTQKSLVISKMDDEEVMGGTMRLGKYEITLIESKIKQIYKNNTIHERNRRSSFRSVSSSSSRWFNQSRGSFSGN